MRTSAPVDPPPVARTAVSGAWPAVLALDVFVVLLFAAAGRRTHSLGVVGVLETAWPFLAGLVVGWAVWRLARDPWSPVRGLALWPTTVAVGMGLRVLTGQGTAPSFVLVTLGVLGVLLLVPRAVAVLVRRPRSRRPA
ncbi:DUF3054 domain-containing protein [Kocuria sp. M1R5S2]|uniref:DUF3054 domain-containing protein n=1 Tax=Kocuria rhizosphaerae TaxID=3376285 RepID=UPI003789F521